MSDTIKTKFKIGDKVRHILDLPVGDDIGLITAVQIRGSSQNVRITYGITWKDKQEKYHDEMELDLCDASRRIGYTIEL